MDYEEQKKFFETAYNTGTDIWTDKHYRSKILEYISLIPDNSLVLDLGSGRGRLAFAMAEMGLRVIGLDYIKSVIEVNNTEVKAKNLEGKIKFTHGDALNISFSDQSFDAVTDFGLLHHIRRDDWQQYASEINRVLKSGGNVLNVSLSKETEHFYDFSPRESIEADFEKYGVYYHFFNGAESQKVFGDNFQIVRQETIYLEKEREHLLITLLLKS